MVRVINLAQGGRVIEVPGEHRADRGLVRRDHQRPARQPAGDRRRQRVVVTDVGPETPPYGTRRVVTSRPRRLPRLRRLHRHRPGHGDGREAPLLELEHVSRVYGEEVEVYALREVSLRIIPGDFMSIVGPVGLGQVHHAGPARRPRPADVGDDPDRRPGREHPRRRHALEAARRLDRLRLPAVPPDPAPHRPRQRRDGAPLPGHPRPGAAGARPTPHSTDSGSGPGPITGRCRCREASSSGWRWPGPS